MDEEAQEREHARDLLVKASAAMWTLNAHVWNGRRLWRREIAQIFTLGESTAHLRFGEEERGGGAVGIQIKVSNLKKN